MSGASSKKSNVNENLRNQLIWSGSDPGDDFTSTSEYLANNYTWPRETQYFKKHSGKYSDKDFIQFNIPDFTVSYGGEVSLGAIGGGASSGYFNLDSHGGVNVSGSLDYGTHFGDQILSAGASLKLTKYGSVKELINEAENISFNILGIDLIGVIYDKQGKLVGLIIPINVKIPTKRMKMLKEYKLIRTVIKLGKAHRLFLYKDMISGYYMDTDRFDIDDYIRKKIGKK